MDGGLGGFGGNRRFLGGWVGDLVFEFDGAYHADTGVATLPVVDYFNPPGNRFFGFASGGPCPPVVEFHFQGGPKRHTHRIIEAHAGASHRLGDTEFLAHLPQLVTGELGTTIGMKYHTFAP